MYCSHVHSMRLHATAVSLLCAAIPLALHIICRAPQDVPHAKKFVSLSTCVRGLAAARCEGWHAAAGMHHMRNSSGSTAAAMSAGCWLALE